MKRKILTMIAAMALTATGVACGGDDGGGGTGPQAEFAAQLIAEADEDGFDIDEACVRRVTAGLSDDDARALLADDDDALSMEGGLKLFELFECIDLDLDFDFDD